MARRSYSALRGPRDVSLDEARALPTFYRVARISRTDYRCEACAEHRAEPWVDGTACPEHTEEQVAYAGTTDSDVRDAELALDVLRAGGNPEPRFAEGTLGYAQWAFRRKGRKAEREALVLALTSPPAERRAA